MTTGAIARAMKAGLAKLGEPSLLRGADCGNAIVRRGLEPFPGLAFTADDNYASNVDVVTLDADFVPRRGDALVHPTAGSFTLDRKLFDNGFIAMFTLLPA